MKRRWFLTAAGALAASLCSNVADAHLRRPPEIGARFDAADRVVLARIDSQEWLGNCGTRYRASVQASFKGPLAPDDTIEFGRWDELRPSVTYLLFLNYVASPQALLDRASQDQYRQYMDLGPTSTVGLSDDFLDSATCHGLVPGYEFEGALAFMLSGDRFVLRNPAGVIGVPWDLPGPVLYAGTYGNEYVISRNSLMLYLKILSGSQR